MNDIEARMMKGKKGNFLVAYNIQSAVDYDTKMICALHVTQSPTDHYLLPEVADKAIKQHRKSTNIHECRHNILKPNKLILLCKQRNRWINTNKKTIQRKNQTIKSKSIPQRPLFLYIRLRFIYVPSRTTNVLLQRIH